MVTSVATLYPAPCEVCMPCFSVVSCRNPKSTSPWCSFWSDVSSPPALPVQMFINASLIPFPVSFPFQTVSSHRPYGYVPLFPYGVTSCACLPIPLCADHSPVPPFPTYCWIHALPCCCLSVYPNARPFPRSEASFPSNGFLSPILHPLLACPRRPSI